MANLSRLINYRPNMKYSRITVWLRLIKSTMTHYYIIEMSQLSRRFARSAFGLPRSASDNDSLLYIAGYPRYCTVTTLPDGTTVLNGGRSRRGKPRGPPGSRELQTALKGCDDPMFLDFIRRCLEWDPGTRMTPNAALRHGWLRRRLPRPPPTGEKSNNITDSPSGTLTSIRSTTNSGTSRTSNGNNAKMNTIASMHSSSNSGSAVTSKRASDNGLDLRHNSTAGSNVTLASTKLPQIPNTIT